MSPAIKLRRITYVRQHLWHYISNHHLGESHGRAVGVVVDGCPSGLTLSAEDVQKELDRRRPGQSVASTQRKEEDVVEIQSGIFEGKTTGTPISMIVWNKDADSGAYDAIRNTPRPGMLTTPTGPSTASEIIEVAVGPRHGRPLVALPPEQLPKSSSPRKASRSWDTWLSWAVSRQKSALQISRS